MRSPLHYLHKFNCYWALRRSFIASRVALAVSSFRDLLTVPILLGLIYRLKAELQPKQLSGRVADEYQLARPALWRANAVEETRLDVGSGDHAGVGHWREHNDVQSARRIVA